MIERVADLLMPWVAAHARVWPSQHAVHEGLMIEYGLACAALRELCEAFDSADPARIVAAREAAEYVLDAVPVGEWG